MRSRCSSLPRGLTLIEMLVVITVIAVLISLILPAVQSAREASWRAGCLNNLKQLGIALNSYQSSFATFPIGYVAWSQPSGTVAPGWAWSAAVLPQLDQAPAYNAINTNLPVDAGSNATVRALSLAIFVCPSDVGVGPFEVNSTWIGGPVEAQTISYAANQGTDTSGNGGNGMFRMNRSVRAKDIRDGMSVTFAVGERRASLVKNAWPGALEDGRGGEQVLALISNQGPCVPNPQTSTFSGPHEQLANFLMADGSARAIRESINLTVYRALATRSGREVVDQQSY